MSKKTRVIPFDKYITFEKDLIAIAEIGNKIMVDLAIESKFKADVDNKHGKFRIEIKKLKVKEYFE